jgi:uncharacterized protein
MTDVEWSEETLAAALRDPALHGGVRPDEKVTAQSRLYLLPDRVYKFKRHVRYAHLDYASPAQRETCARAELRVNQAAGGLYRGVVPLCWDGARWSLGRAGTAATWLVEMDRFDESQQFDRLLSAGQLTTALLDRAIDAIAAMHAAARPEPTVQSPHETLTTLTEQLLGVAPAAERPRLDHWHATMMAEWQQLAPRWHARLAAGQMRAVHGDLHLSNLCVYQGQPVPFDAIEFNPALSSIDILYDIAFLLMDLLDRGRPDLANRALNRWLESGVCSFNGLALLPFYVSLRAGIRAMVRLLEGRDPADYLALMERVLMPMPTPRLIGVGGLSGSGKSSLARALAAWLPGPCGGVHVRADGIRKRLLGVSPETRLPESGYTAAISAQVFAMMRTRAAAALAEGMSVVADSVYLRADERAALEALAPGAFTGLWLDLDEERAAQRLANRHGDASDATLAIRTSQRSRDPGTLTWQRLDASGAPEAVLALAQRSINPPSTTKD